MKSFLCIFLAITTQSQTYPPGGLTCDSLEYVYAGVRVQKPTGVCFIDGTDGVKLQCNSAGDDINWRYYKDTGCSGDFYATASTDDVMELLTIPKTDYSYTCCTGKNCEYVIERTWTATDCTSTGTADDDVNVIGGCTGVFSTGFYQYDSCANDKVTKEYFLSDTEGKCAGTGDTDCASCVVTDGECSSLLNYKTEVMCGTANSVCSGALALKVAYNMIIIGFIAMFINF